MSSFTVKNLLYSEKGTEGARKIWGSFEKTPYEYELVEDEDKEAEEADEQWGYGEPEEAEAEGRRVNGEYALAVRGYGE